MILYKDLIKYLLFFNVTGQLAGLNLCHENMLSKNSISSTLLPKLHLV
jgi:hypothetical protein